MRSPHSWLIILMLFISSAVCSQPDSLSTYLDSLDGVPQNEEVMEVRASLAYRYFYADAEFARSQGHKTLKLADSLGDFWHVAEMYIMLGWAHIETAEWDSCIYYTNLLKEVGPKSGRKGIQGEAYRILAVMHSQKGDYRKSLELNQLALEDAIANEQLDRQAATLNNIGMQYYNQDDTATALQYFNRAKKTYLKIDKDDIYIANVLKNMATIEMDRVRKRQMLDSAIMIYKSNNDWGLVGSAWTNISDYFYDDGNADSCLYYANLAWDQLSTTSTTDRYDAYRVMSKALELKGQYEEAVLLLDTAIAGHASIAMPELENDMYRRKAKLLTEMGRYKEANEAWQKSIELTDSISVESNKEFSQRFNVIYETQKKEEDLIQERQKSELERLKRRNTTFGAIGVLGLLSILFFNFYSHQKKRKELAEEKARLTEKEKEAISNLIDLRTQFFTNISHELKTPLTLVHAPLEELKDREWSDPEIAFKLEMARRNSNRLLDMVQEILQLSKLENGHIDFNPKPIELNTYLRRSFFAFHSLAESRDVELQYESNFENLIVEVDDEHFQRIISNVISNAIKYTRENTAVKLKASIEEKDDQARLTLNIEDQGFGIPVQHAERIFGRFYQSATTKGKEMGGVGIGLSLARELTALMGGNLTLDRSDETGSIFCIQVPLTISKERIDLSTDDEVFDYKPRLEDLKDMTILVVEDNDDMGKYLNQILSDNFNVIWARDGYEGIQKLQTTHPVHLVMSDIMMPKMDGYQLRKQILQMPHFKSIPFLFLSARSLEEDIMQGFQLGADDYITKPFKSKELLARIENLLKNGKERQKLAAEEGVKPEVDWSVLERFESFVRKNLADSSLKLGRISEELNISERQLRRNIKAETGMSPIELILEIRLLKARYLLEKNQFGTVAEVMYQVGIESASYFSKKFTQRFGRSPSSYLNK